MSYLEKIGKLQHRPFLFVTILLLPLFALISVVYVSLLEKKEIDVLTEKVSYLHNNARRTIDYRFKKKKFIEKYSQVDEDFLLSLETLSLLDEEKNKLTEILDHPAFSNQTLLRNRLDQLQNNRLLFDLKWEKKSSVAREKLLQFNHPIEIQSKELETILALIENPETAQKKPPQLIIKHFELHQNNKNNYELSLEVIQREFVTNSLF